MSTLYLDDILQLCQALMADGVDINRVLNTVQTICSLCKVNAPVLSLLTKNDLLNMTPYKEPGKPDDNAAYDDIEFYWDDLTDKKKEEIISRLGGNCNWDIFPFFTYLVKEEYLDE